LKISAISYQDKNIPEKIRRYAPNLTAEVVYKSIRILISSAPDKKPEMHGIAKSNQIKRS
jgi:hypothetical protein